jgi:hypothetical protein
MQDLRRPTRFALRLNAWYRCAGEHEWHRGVTRSVSTSGALIQGDEPSGCDQLDIVIGMSPGGCLVGHGRTVRMIDTAFAGRSTFAVAVERFSIKRRGSVLPPRPTSGTRPGDFRVISSTH